MIPIILICGEAGSGKDTITGFLAKNYGAQSIAFADPMKRFVMKSFKFTEDQLWGPSEKRNAIDTRFGSYKECNSVLDLIANGVGLDDLGVEYGSDAFVSNSFSDLKTWAFQLLKEAQRDGGLTPRKTLQTLGTEWGRRRDSQMWVNQALATAKFLLYGGFSYTRTSGLIADQSVGPTLVVISDGRFKNEVLRVRELGGAVWKIEASTNKAVETAGIPGHKSEAEQRSIPLYWFTAILNNDKSKGLEAAEKMVRDAYGHWVASQPLRAF